MRPVALAFLAFLVAGCSGAGTVADAGLDEDDALAQPGRLCLVVVDEAIRPIEGAVLSVQSADGTQEAVTSTDGVACFDVPDGSYVVEASHALYQSAQTTVDFAAADPPRVARIQLTRLFAQDPFHETRQVEGFIQCGYSVSGVMSSLCMNDYTHFVGPYTCPECEHLLDRRSADFEVETGWQTMVFEMTWEPTQQATSDEMRLTISHFPRPASHWYCSGTGSSPLLVRMEVGVVCEDQQDEPTLVPAEGLPNMHLFAATAASNQPASAIWSQSFQVYMNFFYYGKPPEGWSFVAEDPFPF